MLCGKAAANPRAAAEAQEEHRREDGEERRHRPPEREKRVMKRGGGKYRRHPEADVAAELRAHDKPDVAYAAQGPLEYHAEPFPNLAHEHYEKQHAHGSAPRLRGELRVIRKEHVRNNAGERQQDAVDGRKQAKAKEHSRPDGAPHRLRIVRAVPPAGHYADAVR